MQVKVFYLRLTKDNISTDQDNLNKFLESISVRKISTELIIGQPNFWSILVFFDEKKMNKLKNTFSSDKIFFSSDTELTLEESKLFESLKNWRQEKASELNVPNFMICHNTELISVIKIKPQFLTDFIKIKGFGEQKVAKYGDEILAILNS